MNDITALAQREMEQREKFEAWTEESCALPWGYLKKRRTYDGFYSEHTYTSLWAAWKAASMALVEALEKAQQRIAELESRTVTVKRVGADQMHRICLEATRHLDKYAAMAREVNKLLGSAATNTTPAHLVTVKLPRLHVSEVMLVSGFSRDYAEGWCAGNDNARHEIRAAGIQVIEGEGQ